MLEKEVRCGGVVSYAISVLVLDVVVLSARIASLVTIEMHTMAISN